MPMSRWGSVTYLMNYYQNIFVASLLLLYSEAVLNDILFIHKLLPPGWRSSRCSIRPNKVAWCVIL